jgi:iron-only hydrogenase group A
MKEINLTINQQKVTVPEGTTILDAAKKIGVKIPTLCHHEDLHASGRCGICVVEVKGVQGLKRSCCTAVTDGMEINTNSDEVRSTRKMITELILSNHPDDCLRCIKSENCELQDLTRELGIRDNRFPRLYVEKEKDEKSLSVIRDPSKCILCGRCVEVCNEVQTAYAIEIMGRGFDSYIGTPLNAPLADTSCINCGQCITVCPVGALYEKSEIELVWEALNNPSKHVVVQEAPAVRVAIGEEFGFEPGHINSGKMHSALKRLGFDKVFDTNFAADVTIMEEGTEVVNELKKALETNDMGRLPILTSCSPGWVKFIETFFPKLLGHVSSAKSPQQMFGALAKTYYAEKAKIPAKDIVSVSIMPCTAKKYEARRPEMRASGFQDVDYVLTTREFAQMIREAGIDFANLPEIPAEEMMGAYTGAATIFGVTGGVMEAALRTAYELVSGKPLEKVDLEMVRGMKGVKEAIVPVPLTDGNTFNLKVAVAHGLGNARKLLDKVSEEIERDGKSSYHFIEIMACPGGCVGGGGQPYGSTIAVRARRGEGLYQEDRNLPVRRSHQNKAVIKLYEDYLGEPNSHKAHELLHTNYSCRNVINGKVE